MENFIALKNKQKKFNRVVLAFMCTAMLFIVACGSSAENNAETHITGNTESNTASTSQDITQEGLQVNNDLHGINGTWLFDGFRVRVGDFKYYFDQNNITITLTYRTSGSGNWPTFFGEQNTWELLYSWQEGEIELERYSITGMFTLENEIIEFVLSNGAVIQNHIFQTLNVIEITPLGTGYTVGTGTMHFFREEPAVAANNTHFEVVEFGGTTWLVLDSDQEAMLLLREHVLEDNHNFNRRGELDLGWHNSDLRRWLNGTYLNSFDPYYRDRIRQTNVNNTLLFDQHIPDTSSRATPENDTTDRVFILSVEEAVLYFTTLNEIQLNSVVDRLNSELGSVFAGQTSQLLQAESSRHAPNYEGIVQSWWLRTPDLSNVSGFSSNSFRRFIVLSNSTRFIGENIGIPAGSIGRTDVNNNRVYVRPAMWVYFEAPSQAAPDTSQEPTEQPVAATPEGTAHPADTTTQEPTVTAPNQETAVTAQEPWMIAYAEILREMSVLSFEYGDAIGFLLHDIDGNGIPELIIDGSGDGSSMNFMFGYSTLVYTFRNGRAIPLKNPELLAIAYPAATSRTRLVSPAVGVTGILRNDYPSGSNYHSLIVMDGYSLISIATWGSSWDTTDMDMAETFTSQIGTSFADRIEISQAEFDEFQAMIGNGLYMQRVTYYADIVRILSMAR